MSHFCSRISLAIVRTHQACVKRDDIFGGGGLKNLYNFVGYWRSRLMKLDEWHVEASVPLALPSHEASGTLASTDDPGTFFTFRSPRPP
jgi:hypothetical protein